MKIKTRLLVVALWPGLLIPGAGRAASAEVGARLALPAQAAQDAEVAYRQAREALNRGSYERAIGLFGEMREAWPDSRYVADSYYWQAFAAYRLEELRESLDLIERQLELYPRAPTAAQARELQLRVRSLLGRRGDAAAAELAQRDVERALLASSVERAVEAELAAVELAARAEEISTAQAEQAQRAAAELAVRAEVTARANLRGSLQQACEEDDVRQAAINALMHMDSDRALPVLMRVLERRDECSAPLRKQAVFVLSQHHGAEVEDLMLDVARNDPDAEVQEAAVFWLSQVDSERAVDALTDILATSDDPRIQDKAIFALSQHHSERAGAILRDYALDASKPDHIREQAIFWISQHHGYADASFLIELYDSLESANLKEKVFFALSQTHDQAAIDWMLERAVDPAAPVELRKQALFWAGQSRMVDLSRLRGLYESVPDREMKEQLIFLYSQRHEPEAVDRLIEIARSETDRELRKKAIFWLGQSGDERAIEFLLELVNEP